MKATGTVISGFIIIVAGVALCILNSHPDIITTIIRIVGAAFALAGLINIMIMMRRRQKHRGSYVGDIVGWLSGIGGLCLGCVMLILPQYFTPIIVFFFGALLILGALFQISLLAWGYKPYTPSGWLYVLPILTLIGGVVMVSSDSVKSSDSAMILITGIGFIFYGITSFMALIGVAGSRKTDVDSSVAVATQPSAEPKHAETATTTDSHNH